MQTPIKAVLFDMCGVLLFKKDDYRPTTDDEVNALRIEDLYNHLDDQKLLEDVKRKYHLSDEQINRAIPYIPAKFEIFKDLWNLLPELKKHFKLAIINNGNGVAKKYWSTLFDFDIFDLFINSAEVKIRKPDPAIFLLACKQLEVKPDECFYIDDARENVDAAKRLGMTALWWNKENGKDENLNSFKKLIFSSSPSQE